ncbi:Peroxygenase [Acorus calamus]|uniref:Peroxygenase n=1 Tax=Acorus calamus TaxID=4465 RepID=A0AAV9E6T2_ACOCL|nr:Peroxygenase [Acorus calamus]
MSSSRTTDQSLQTFASEAAVTMERKINLKLQNQMPLPYLPRALVAADPCYPDGTKGRDHHNMSVLQQHVSFFDRNKDGIVYPWETYQGFRDIGCGYLLSIAAGLFINLGISYPTLPGYMPSLLFPIHIKNIHKGKHGSDTESYDTEGRFVPSKFDEIFSKYGLTHHDALTYEEISKMLKTNRNLNDFNGWLLSFTEWKILYNLGKDEKGLLHRETIRAVYDGSLFDHLETKRAARMNKN